MPSPTAPLLSDTLRREPYRFGFFQAVRLLRRLYPQFQPVGHGALPQNEVVRLRAHTALVFPPSEIHDLILPVEAQTESLATGEQVIVPAKQAQLIVSFLGLTGPSGALPRYYTETILDRARQKDFTLRDFLDLFNHRLLSLFFRAWEKNRFWVGYERAEIERRNIPPQDASRQRAFVLQDRPHLDRFSQALLDLAGLGPGPLRYRAKVREKLVSRTSLSDETLRYYVGLFAQQHRSAAGLEGILQDYFQARITVQQFVPQWLQLEPENQTRLSASSLAQLGTNVIIGERVRDVQSKFRVRLGPLSYAQYRDFLPDGTAFQPLAKLTRLYVGPQYDIDSQLILKSSEVPNMQLSSTSTSGTRLGWDTWLHSQPLKKDPDDAILTWQT